VLTGRMHGRTDACTHGHTEALTDGQPENIIPPSHFRWRAAVG